MGGRGARVVAGIVLALLAVALGAAPAWGHALLTRSDPASGTALPSAPSSVRLWFSEPLASRYSIVDLRDAHGRLVPGTRLVTGADPSLLQLTVPSLTDGDYAVCWSVLADDDGHRTAGTVVFAVGAGTTRAGLPRASDDTVSEPVTSSGLVVLRWSRLLPLSVLVGSLAVALLTGARPELAASRRRLLQLAALASALALVASGVEASVTGTSGAGGGPADYLQNTHVGRLMLLQGLLVVVLGAVSLRLAAQQQTEGTTAPGEGSPRTVGALVATLVGLLALCETLRSHVDSLPSPTAVAVVAGTLHVAAALTWLGLLPALVVVVLPRATRASALRGVGAGFSRLAGWCVAALAATGVYGAGREVHDVSSLWTTTYGRILVVKATLLGIASVLALVNNRRLQEPGRTSLRPRLVAVEAGVGAFALLAAAMLAESIPSPRVEATAEAAPSLSSIGVLDDLTVSLAASPGRPGLNSFSVVVSSSRRPAPAPLRNAALVLPGDQPIALNQVEPGHFLATGRLGSAQDAITVRVNRDGRRLGVPLSWRSATRPETSEASTASEAGRPVPLNRITVPLAVATAAVGAVLVPTLAPRRRRRRLVTTGEVTP
jgi:copper transport protein